MSLIPYPENITLKKWAAELVRLYPRERFPILINKDKWRSWANLVVNQPAFKKNSVPGPGMETKEPDLDNKAWKKWAKTVHSIMINARNK